MNTDQPMSLKEVKLTIHHLRIQELLTPAQYESLLHHLEAGKRDTDRLNWMESNESTGFERWSTGWGVSDHSFPDLRQAIDFEMGGKP